MTGVTCSENASSIFPSVHAFMAPIMRDHSDSWISELHGNSGYHKVVVYVQAAWKIVLETATHQFSLHVALHVHAAHASCGDV